MHALRREKMSNKSTQQQTTDNAPKTGDVPGPLKSETLKKKVKQSEKNVKK
jgi:hypothetical protein